MRNLGGSVWRGWSIVAQIEAAWSVAGWFGLTKFLVALWVGRMTYLSALAGNIPTHYAILLGLAVFIAAVHSWNLVSGMFRSRRIQRSQHFVSQTIYLAELARDNEIIHGKKFEHCKILGPGVIVPLRGNLLLQNNWNGDSEDILIEVPLSRKIHGAIGIEGCEFKWCEFRRIGIIGDSAFAQAWRQDPSPRSKRAARKRR